MDDFIGVLYIELLDKSLNRCIIDWKCFKERILLETNKSNLRTALIQYCRGQREIFLKLKVLFDVVKYQKTVDKLLQKSLQYDQYIDNSIQDISRNICVIENNIMPSPNVALGVDLLNSFSYSRMPSMVGEVSKSSVDNTIPIMKMDPENVDLCLNRLKIHFYVLFRLSKCFNLCKIEFDNGKCQFIRDNFFQVELLYDFNQYQITKLKIFVNNHEVFNIINLMNYILNYNLNSSYNSSELNMETDGDNSKLGVKDNSHKYEEKNIFDVLYNMLNDYIGKMVMKYLYKQAINYCNSKFIIFQYNLENLDENNNNRDNREENKEQTYKNNNKKGEDNGRQNKELEQLSIECFVKYKYKYRYKDREQFGLVLKFSRYESGDVDLRVEELDIKYSNIYNYHLDHWIQVVSNELEGYQTRVVKEQLSRIEEEEKNLLLMVKKNSNNLIVDIIEDNYKDRNGSNNNSNNNNNRNNNNKEDNNYGVINEIWVNRMNGSLNLKGYQCEFSLNEAKMILKLYRIVKMLNDKYRRFSPFTLQFNNTDQLFDKTECKICNLVNESNEDIEMEGEMDNNLMSVLLGDNKQILYNENNNYHILVSYRIYPSNFNRIYPSNFNRIYDNNMDNEDNGYNSGDNREQKKEQAYKNNTYNNDDNKETNNNEKYDRDNNYNRIDVYNTMNYNNNNNFSRLNLQTQFELVLNVLVHDYVVFNNNILVLDDKHNLLGTVDLGFIYQIKMNYNELLMLLNVLDKLLKLEFIRKPNKIFKDKRYFITDKWDRNKTMIFNFINLNFSIEIDMNGIFKKVLTDKDILTFNEDKDPNLIINSLLDSNVN